MSRVLVAVPVLWRPERIEGTLRAFGGVDVLFLPDEDDAETVDAIKQVGANYSFAHVAKDFGVPTYETKVNHAFDTSSHEFVLYASDDVAPQNGWLQVALERLDTRPHVGLLGTNDGAHHLVRKRLLATHGFVRRSYVLEFGSASLPDAGSVFFEGYRHWCCDAEASYVARSRGAFDVALDCLVTHNRRAAVASGGADRTYDLGAAYSAADKALLKMRCPGWPEVARKGL